jgi:outer membrane protein assembly factor BamB
MKGLHFIAAVLIAGAWPQFLGPDRNNTTRETIAPGAALSVLWRAPIEGGRSSLVTTDTHVYAIGSDGDTETLVALEVATGRETWRTSLGPAHASFEPIATPAIVGDTIVSLTSLCVLHGNNARTGAAMWQRSLVTDYKGRLIRGGCAMSPLIDGSTVVVPTGSPLGGTMVAAFNAATGETVWTLSGVPSSQSTPMGVGQFGGERLLLYHYAKPPSNSGVAGIRVKGTTAEVAWQADLPSNLSDTAPLALPGNKVLLQTWNDSSMIDVSAAPRILWSTTDLWALYPPPASHGDTVYGFGGNSTEFFSAVDATSGKTLWTERIYRGYAINAGGTLVVMSEASGLLRLIAADRSRYRELARLALFRPGARSMTPPTVSGGRIFVRNLEEVAAIAVK